MPRLRDPWTSWKGKLAAHRLALLPMHWCQSAGGQLAPWHSHSHTCTDLDQKLGCRCHIVKCVVLGQQLAVLQIKRGKQS